MAKLLSIKDGNIEVTDTFKKITEVIQAAPAKKFGLKRDTVEVWEDGYRTAGIEHSFEWWYFDCHLDDGSSCVVIFFTKPNLKPKLPMKPSILLMYRSPEGETRKEWLHYSVSEFSSSTERCDVKIGTNWARGDLEHYEVHASAAGVTCSLFINREVPSWRPGGGIIPVDPFQKYYFGWVAPVPHGAVEGKLTVDGKERIIRGTAYHDHNWGTILIALIFDHWYWGRGHIGDYCIIFSQMVTNSLRGFGAIKVPVFFMTKGNEILIDDFQEGWPLRVEPSELTDGPSGRKYPMKLDMNWKTEKGDISVAISNPRMIAEIDLRGKNDDETLPAKLLMQIIASSYHCDFDADAELKVKLNGLNETVNGHLIFEQMLMHRKQRRQQLRS